MDIQIKRTLIETKLKKGFFVEIDNQFKRIQDIDENDVITFTDKGTSTVEECQGRVVKFIGLNKGQPYSIFHGDFENIIEYLKNKFKVTVFDKDENGEITATQSESKLTGTEILIEGGNVEYKGHVDKVLCNAQVGFPIVINNIKIIDQYKLYEMSDRMGTIKKSDKYDFEIEMKNSNRSLKLNRSDFELVGRRDFIFMIHIVCPYCNK